MPFSSGPNTVNDSIVFNYDIGDTTNSYKGEPTTNYQNGISPWTVGGINTDVTGTSEQGPIANAKTWKFQKTGGSDQWNGWESTYGGIWTGNAGDTWTTSYWYKTSAPAGISGFGVGGFYTPDWSRSYNITILGGSTDIIADGQWRYGWVTTQFNENYSNAIIVDGPSWGYSNQAGLLYINGLQWEKKPHPTPFAGYSRSTTQGLLDISGRGNTITLATSYDNNAQPYFDATDDFISLGSDVTFKTTGGWTVESIVYYNSVAGAYNNTTSPANFIGSEDIIYNSWYWSVLENKLALWNISPGYWRYGSTILQPNRWYYVALVSSAGGLKYQFYLNGVAEGGDHVSQTWNPDYSGLRIRYIGKGNNANTRLVNGRINVTKAYDRALTATEIQNNYLAYKTRFNLS